MTLLGSRSRHRCGAASAKEFWVVPIISYEFLAIPRSADLAGKGSYRWLANWRFPGGPSPGPSDLGASTADASTRLSAEAGLIDNPLHHIAPCVVCSPSKREGSVCFRKLQVERVIAAIPAAANLVVERRWRRSSQ